MGSEFVILIFFLFITIAIAVVAGILAVIAFTTTTSLRKELAALRTHLASLPRPLAPPQPPAQPFIPSPAAPPAPSAPPTPAPSPPPQPTPAPYTAPASVPHPLPPTPADSPSLPSAPPPSPIRPLAGSPGREPPTPAPSPLRPFAPSPVRQPPSSLESNIGQRWLAWAGAIIVFFACVFFLILAFQSKWIGPTGQVVICALGSHAILATGSYFTTKSWRVFGQALMGLGLGILYATFAAAFHWYAPPVLGQQTAFACIVLVTVAGMALAILHNGFSTAFLAVLGGLLTPLLVSTGQDSRESLFTYLLLLDLGVLAVAFFRQWRTLDTLALVGTMILYAGWYGQFYDTELNAFTAASVLNPAAHAAAALPLLNPLLPALLWLAAFYLIFLILPFAYHLVRKQTVTIERFLMALANAFFFAAYAWWTLEDKHLHAMGFIALAMAACYVILGSLLRSRLPNDGRALFGQLALAVTFLTLAVPMQLHAEGITLAWVAEAPLLVFLAYRYRYAPVRILAAAVLLLGIGRLFFFLFPLHEPDVHYTPFLNRYFLSAICVPAAAAVFAAVHQWYRADGALFDRALKIAAALIAGILALIVLHIELSGFVADKLGDPAAHTVVAALWALGAAAYLAAGIQIRPAAPFIWAIGTLALCVAAVLALIAYADRLAEFHLLFANARFAAALLGVAVAFAFAWALAQLAPRWDSPHGIASIVALAAALFALLTLLSTEVYTYCTDIIPDSARADRAGQMSITLVWSLFAAALLFTGFWKRTRPIRIAGLALFALAALKLVLIDLTSLNSIYRIISFLALGLLLLLASYLYHKLAQRLTTPHAPDTAPDTAPASIPPQPPAPSTPPGVQP